MIALEATAKSYRVAAENTAAFYTERDSNSQRPTFEYFEPGKSVQIWKNGINWGLSITNPRWDATHVFDPRRFRYPEVDLFHPERFGFTEEKSGGDISQGNGHPISPFEVPIFTSTKTQKHYPTQLTYKNEMALANGAELDEFFTDVTDVITQTVKAGLRQGLEENGEEIDEIQQAVISLAINASLRLQKVTRNPLVEHTMRQFTINTMQRIQIEAKSQRTSVNKSDIGRKFDRELKKAKEASPPTISSNDKEFMVLDDVERWENITMTMVEQKIGPENIDAFTQIREAVELAKKRHKGQIHLGLHPYPVHLFRVMLRIMEDKHCTADKNILRNTLTLAALHDIFEDTDTSPEEIENKFGTEIKDHVLTLSKWVKVNGVPDNWDPNLYFGKLETLPEYGKDVKGYDRVDNVEASQMKVDIDVEDKMKSINEQDLYMNETILRFPRLVSHNPVLAGKLQKVMKLDHFPDITEQLVA